MRGGVAHVPPVRYSDMNGDSMSKTITSIGDLIPDSANARLHNPRNIGMIALHQLSAARSSLCGLISR